jgi:hypothetical protein
LEDGEYGVRVDFIDGLGTDRPAVGDAEGHLPLGDMLFVPDFGFVAVDAFVREGTKIRNGTFRIFIGLPMLRGFNPRGKK